MLPEFPAPMITEKMTKRIASTESLRLSRIRLSHILLKSKLLLQDLWINNVDWDTEIDYDIKQIS